MKRLKGLRISFIGISVILFAFSIGFGEEEFLKRGKEGGIAFLSGGVGLRERAILEEMGRPYSLKLIFSNKRGEYLADVVVKVIDKDDRNILTTVSNGPWLFIDLPSGTYHLEASFGGDWKRISGVIISGEGQKVIFVQW